MGMWKRNEYKTEIMYFYYIIMKIYILVYINIYSLIYFLYITTMTQPSSYCGFYTLVHYIKTFED
jgi:hypothetical protein